MAGRAGSSDVSPSSGRTESASGLDLRQAVHSINPGAFWHPTLNGEPPPHPLLFDNPFTVIPYRTADARWVMASGVYPHQVAKWCRFLGRAARRGQGRHGHRGMGRLRARRGGERTGSPDLRRAKPRRMGGARTRSVADRPTGDWPRAHRRGSCARFRAGSTAVRGCPRAVVHPRGGGSNGRPDIGRTRSRRARAPPAPMTTSTTSSTPRPMWDRAAPISISTHLLAESVRRRLLADADVVVDNYRTGLARPPRARSSESGRSAPWTDFRVSQLLRPDWPMGRPRWLRHERVSGFGSHDR